MFIRMYRGLFNPRVCLSLEDFRAIGLLNANLLLRWNHWVHRRVESAVFIAKVGHPAAQSAWDTEQTPSSNSWKRSTSA
jgi:hypothetical protein